LKIPTAFINDNQIRFLNNVNASEDEFYTFELPENAFKTDISDMVIKFIINELNEVIKMEIVVLNR